MVSARSPDDDPLEAAERLIEADRAREAAALLGGLIAEGRGGLLARLAHAKALAAAGEDPVDAARETALLYPGVAAAAVGLGEALLKAERLPTAIAEFQRALRLDPGLDAARLKLAAGWLEAGEPDKALEALAALDPATPGAFDLVARAQAMRGRTRSDAGYVRHLFDQFSADYDARMRQELSYRAPEILRALADLVMPGQTNLAILDLGCGTGLAGAAFRDLAGRLDGIDLSPAMLAKARARGTYDGLAVGDIESGTAWSRYDLALAADTLVYLGDLGAVLRAAAGALKPGAFFLFTVEKKEGEGYELGPKRRWRHAEPYLRDAASAAGFAVAGLMDCVPRMEAHAAVSGFAVALRKEP